jgi:hypothetical protein
MIVVAKQVLHAMIAVHKFCAISKGGNKILTRSFLIFDPIIILSLSLSSQDASASISIADLFLRPKRMTV